MNNEEKINWFGTPSKRKIKPKVNSNYNFLGMNLKSNVSFLGNGSGTNKIPQKVNFLGPSKKYKMPTSVLFRKESTKKKRLSKWGDADLDGTPNYFDCDPRNAFKDAKKNKVYKDVMGKTVEQLSAEYLERKRGPIEKQQAERMLQKIEENYQPKSTSKQLKGIQKEEVLSQVRQNITALREAERAKVAEEKAQRREAARERRAETTAKIKKRVGETSKAGYRSISREFGKAFGEIGSTVKERVSPTVYSELKESAKLSKAAEQELQKKEKEWALAFEEGRINEKQYGAFQDLAAEERAKSKARETRIAATSARGEKVMKMMKGTGLQAGVDVAKFIVEEKIAAGKKPSKKELAALARAEKKVRKIGDIQAEGRISREILTKVPMGEVGRVITGAAVTKEGEYSRALKAKSRRVKAMTRYAAGQIFGENLLRTRFDSEPRGRGRPAGPSGEYRIGGRPVYEAEFQQYAAKQNALNRMLPSQQQSATLNPEYIAYMKAKQAAERGETKTVYTEDGMPMEGIPQAEQSEGLPTMGSSMMQTGQQQIEMQQKRAYQRATPDEVKAAQYQAQAIDNPLMAPNFMKGELKAAGGSILTPIGPSILEAPQVFKGEMRNVVKANPDEGEVKLSERPQTNPYGDEWLDIEIGSGKPVIRKRVREKWMTGEAL